MLQSPGLVLPFFPFSVQFNPHDYYTDIDLPFSVIIDRLIPLINTYRHSTPMTRKFFFKNENAADRVTLLGIVINVVLSIAKFWGGLAFNSAVLISDAGHSLSDLFSDFITLWAVQVARLPADEDHPYGHGKFESVGSLFLSLTLLVTGT